MAAVDLANGMGTLNLDAGPSKPRQSAQNASTKPLSQPYQASSNPSSDEQSAVHDVYEAIAPHFSLTRFKPWPMIASFLADVPAGSIGLDSGAGNGKYIPCARASGAEMIPMDRSAGLLRFAKGIPAFYNGRGEEGEYWKELESGRQARGEAVRGDLTARCWRPTFDFAISIAAVHHLSTTDRRANSIGAILSSLQHTAQAPYSSFMIYVWAYEQGKLSKRNIGIRGNKETKTVKAALQEARQTPGVLGQVAGGAADTMPGAEPEEKVQDLLVPWVVKPNRSKGKQDKVSHEAVREGQEQVFHRYYHLFVDGELQGCIETAAEREGYDYLGLHEGELADPPVKEGEGRDKWLRLTGLGWEMDNWWIMGQVGRYI